MITDINDLTPIEKRGDYWFKRDDFYRPFDFSPVNGSKLRQCQLLIEDNMDTAKNGIITGTSVLSPQSAIVASVAKHKKIPCFIYYGGTTYESLLKKKIPSLCVDLDAKVEIVSKMGYTSVLNAKAIEKAQLLGLFNVQYGFDLQNNLNVFFESVAKQVENIPDDIENIVITVGSGITLIGVLWGIVLFNKKVKNIYAIGCAPNRINKINNYSNIIYFIKNISLPIHKIIYIDAFNEIKGYKYENTINANYNGITFHPRYEAKTFNWLNNNNKIINGKTLMWITGGDF